MCIPNILKLAALGPICALLFACGGEAPEPADPTLGEPPETVEDPDQVWNWTLITTWPKNLPGAGAGAETIAERLGVLSRGRLNVSVHGAGELVGAFEVFDAVSAGTAEMGHGAAYYWRGKMPASPLFSTVPFGLTAQEMNGWLYYGGGLALWRELYAPFSVIPFPAGNTGAQMAGWFNREIETLDDLKGLKMRIPGLGGEVLERAGGAPENIPASEVFTALQTGVIDATEWIGPYNDLALGLYTAGRYYYYPGWHEPGAVLEMIVNQDAFDALPADLQGMLEVVAAAANVEVLADYTARSGSALATLVNEHQVQLRRLPPEVLQRLREESEAVLAEFAGQDELSARIYESYRRYFGSVQPYTDVAEKAYLDVR